MRAGSPASVRASGGFSLLEMLVALVILSLSLGSLYQSATAAIRNVSVADQYSRATMLAESMLASASDLNTEKASVSGTFDIYRWQTTAWPAENPLAPGNEAPFQGAALQYVRVTVTWPGGQSDRKVSLLTVVPVRQASP
ncbi:MAG: type II secretion system protein [Halieaceae bacterium]